jgi:pimeloyl-ACP methyl ester carboxylesterase
MARTTTFANDGLSFRVRDEGPEDGDVVVLLHGWPQDASAWDRVAPLLHAEGFRTLAPDLRGASPGARPRRRRAYALPVLEGDVLALLDAAGLDAAHVVGHDWGAGLAWALAADHPERVRTLTAVSVPHPQAFVRAMGTSTQALRSWYMAFFQLPAVPEVVLRARGGKVAERMLTGAGASADDARRMAARLQDRATATGGLSWYRGLPFASPTGVGVVRVPTLHVWSTSDPALGRKGAERTARFVDAPYRLEVIEGASHWIPEQHPAELVAAMLPLLRTGRP